MRIVKNALEFEWDSGNSEKSERTHGVTDKEAEEPFFDKYKKTFSDTLHSGGEERLRVIGKTKKGRLLFIVFTMRKKKARIISARDVNKKEVQLYEKGA